MKSARIRELDGVRGVAILMVLVWHYYTAQTGPADPLTFAAAVRSITELFWSGVDLFFVLSGFLIGGIILDHHGSAGFLRVFWIRRCCRILPPMALLLVSCAAGYYFLDRARFAWLFDNLMPWWSYATFTQNILMGLRGMFGGHFLDVTWSLAVEEQFYIFAPLLVLLLGPRRWVQVLPLLIFAALALRLCFPGFQTYVNTPFRMDSLLSGFLLAALFRSEAASAWLHSRRRWAVGLFFIMALATLWRAAHGGFGQFGHDAAGAFAFTWFAALYALFILVVLLHEGSPLTAPLRAGALCFLGAVSYGLYLYHQPVSGLLHGWLGHSAVPQLSYVTLLALVVSTGFAWISFRCFESPFLRWGRRHVYDRSSGN